MENNVLQPIIHSPGEKRYILWDENQEDSGIRLFEIRFGDDGLPTVRMGAHVFTDDALEPLYDKIREGARVFVDDDTYQYIIENILPTIYVECFKEEISKLEPGNLYHLVRPGIFRPLEIIPNPNQEDDDTDEPAE